jgi:hypothetical protein
MFTSDHVYQTSPYVLMSSMIPDDHASLSSPLEKRLGNQRVVISVMRWHCAGRESHPEVHEEQKHLVCVKLLRNAIGLAPQVLALRQVGCLNQALYQIRRGNQVPLNTPCRDHMSFLWQLLCRGEEIRHVQAPRAEDNTDPAERSTYT